VTPSPQRGVTGSPGNEFPGGGVRLSRHSVPCPRVRDQGCPLTPSASPTGPEAAQRGPPQSRPSPVLSKGLPPHLARARSTLEVALSPPRSAVPSVLPTYPPYRARRQGLGLPPPPSLGPDRTTTRASPGPTSPVPRFRVAPSPQHELDRSRGHARPGRQHGWAA